MLKKTLKKIEYKNYKYYNIITQMDNDIILKRLPGFPAPHIFKMNYKQINNIDEVDESFIGKKIIVLIRYNKLLFGNFHKDFLYIGELTYPLIKKDDYNTHIWIKETRLNKYICLSKKRFSEKTPNIELYINQF